jgi:hypothetical protein
MWTVTPAVNALLPKDLQQPDVGPDHGGAGREFALRSRYNLPETGAHTARDREG